MERFRGCPADASPRFARGSSSKEPKGIRSCGNKGVRSLTGDATIRSIHPIPSTPARWAAGALLHPHALTQTYRRLSSRGTAHARCSAAAWPVDAPQHLRSVATSTPRSRLSSSRSAAANSACDANHNPKRNRVNGWRPNPPSTTTTQNMLCVGTLPGSRYQKARRLAEGEGRYVSFETTMHLQPAVRPRAARSRHQASFWGSSQSQSKERGPFLHSSPTSHLPMQSDTLFMKMGAGTRGAAPRCPTLPHAAPRRHVIELTRTRGRVNASTLDVEVKAMFSCFFGQ